MESHDKRTGRICDDDTGSMSLSPDIKANLLETPLHRKNQRGEGRERLESPKV
jgi:hypothetical protein